MPGRATALDAHPHARERAGLSWGHHLNRGARKPLAINSEGTGGGNGINVGPVRAEANETAASANALDGAAITTPGDEQAAFYKLVVCIEIGGAGHAYTPREAMKPSTTA